MRNKRTQPKNRPQAAPIALFAFGACALAVGCQGPQLDHVDGSGATFNANRIPSVDRPPALAETGLKYKSSSSVSGEAAGSATQPAADTTNAAVVENLNLGHREAALGRLDQAESYYRRVLEIEPENSVANHRLAVIADKKRDFARAEHYYLTALRHDGRNPDLLGDLGYSYLLQGRREESERYLLAATRLDPAHAKSLHNLSLLYAKNGDYDRSFDALRRAVGESEARVKIARLFPSGRPAANDGGPMIASFDPSSPPPDSSSASAVEMPAAVPATNGLSVSAATRVKQPVASDGPPDAPPGTPRPAEAVGPSTARVPDSQINDLFAAIDREAPEEPSAQSAAFPSPEQVNLPASTLNPQATAVTRTAAAGGFNAADLRAAPSADPLGSMPLWPSAAAASAERKPPAGFLFEDGKPAPKSPHAVPTGILPASANGQVSPDSGKRDALSEFETELNRQKQTVSGGRTRSNAGLAREPLIAERPGQNGTEEQRSAADNAFGPVAPEAAPPLRIQPGTNPSPLFEPVDGFGPTGELAPANKSTGNDPGPAIRPRSAD